jgi:hypothetical protein
MAVNFENVPFRTLIINNLVGLNLTILLFTLLHLSFHFMNRASGCLKFVSQMKHNVEKLRLAERQVRQMIFVIF